MSSARKATPPPAKGVAGKLAVTYGKLPLAFARNQGQTDPHVRFLARGKGYSLFLTPTEAVFGLQKLLSSAAGGHPDRRTTLKSNRAVLRMRLAGANPQPDVAGQQPLGGKLNYILGRDPAQWHTNVAAYGQVRYQGVYPGIDLLYYGNQQQLEYDFTVAPQADPNKINLDFAGAKRLRLDKAGDLIVSLAGGDVRWHRPVCYQSVAGARRNIAGKYVLRGRHQVGFAVAAYDKTQPLVIDPTLAYSTYLGGSADDVTTGIAVDGSGSAYISGYTYSTDYPKAGTPYQTSNKGQTDAFVSKFSPDGSSLVYSTYVGGSDYEYCRGIAVDSAGSAYVVGDTSSTNFPVTTGAAQTAYGGDPSDAFVLKLSADGSTLLYSTYLGGNDLEIGSGIAVDAVGSAYVIGFTLSDNFFVTSHAVQKTYGGGQDAFVVKLAPNGRSRIYSTYLGGSGDEEGNAIAVDKNGNAYVTGYTTSPDFPGTTGFYQPTYGGDPGDAFVVKLDATGSTKLYSTYLGGSDDDTAYGIAVDSTGSAYVAGATASTDFPKQNPYQNANNGGYDVFVSRLSPDGKSLVYSTYLGGGFDDWAYGIAVDGAGNAYVTGYTVSTDFPTSAVTAPLQLNNAGVEDAFLAKLNAAGSLTYGAYLGGSASDVGAGVALGWGNVYLGGYTFSSDFMISAAPYQMSNSGGYDAFVTRVDFSSARYDFNGDSHVDIFFQNDTSGDMLVWYMNGLVRTGAAYVYRNLSRDLKIAAVADFNGDGQNDLLFQNQANGGVGYWAMNGIQRIGLGVLTPSVPANLLVSGAADFDGDSKPDLIVEDTNTGALSVWLMDGTSFRQNVLLYPGVPDTPTSWRIVGNSNLYGNGTQAIFWVNPTNRLMMLWTVKNLHIVSRAYLNAVPPPNWQPIGVVDLKGNGTPSLVLYNASTNRLTVWYLSGTTVTSKADIVPNTPTGYRATGLR
jgi:hypothetical protein